MAYGNFEDLPIRTASDTKLHAKNPKYDRYQRGLASLVDKCFDKNSSCSVG